MIWLNEEIGQLFFTWSVQLINVEGMTELEITTGEQTQVRMSSISLAVSPFIVISNILLSLLAALSEGKYMDIKTLII